jgi:hypothetical protein
LRVLEGVDLRGSVEFSDFELFFAVFLVLLLFVPFVGVAIFPLLDDILELFLSFWSSRCSSWNLKFEL